MSSYIFARDDCTNSAGGDSCEVPADQDRIEKIVIGVICGVVLIGLFGVLIYLHTRRQRRDKREWTKDPQELDDYGLGREPASTNNVAAPRQAHPHDRSYAMGSGLDGLDDKNLGVPIGRISVDSTQSLARSLRQSDHAFASKPQTPRAMV
ncbi:hypothetical protein BJ170DRAFT_463973 [Xylariales sp. AK1849]|nr:hypothetical protein BJ170DRAFT_463973 [Xylariales sp. AK1849]